VWTQEATGLTDQTISSLFGQSENDLYAFGNKGATLHRVGGTWRLESVRQFSTGASGVTGIAVPGTAEYYATGTQGLILRLNNNVWATESSLTLLPSTGIAAATSTDVISVGANGLILHKY
jgi:RES domain-containing protein